jgi:inner membrane protein
MESTAMNRSLGIKLGAIGLLIILLLIPLFMIDGLISERKATRNGVLTNIAQSSSYRQQITGPILVVPYRQKIREWKTAEKTGVRYQEEHVVTSRLYVLPESFNLNGEINTELRARGIYQARLFKSDNQISGHFEVPANYGITEDLADYQFDEPFLAVGISDIRGISNALKLELNGQKLDFEPGFGDDMLANGVHAPLGKVDSSKTQQLTFAFNLKLQGTSSYSVVPIGRDTQVQLHSDWPHPSFFGQLLPSEREISAEGFNANWQTSFFATNMEQVLRECVNDTNCTRFDARSFGVSFVDPVDQYLKTDRAIKYALLFIGLTFAGFFLMEVLKRLAVHPVQYGLVGLALALFYLLLLSLSEHLDFELAYGISAAACVALVGFYVCHVLHSWLRGAGFTLGLAGLYGVLYVLLSAEDYALLMGSLLVFGLLACVMLLTRKLDWYGVGKTPAAEPHLTLEPGLLGE